MHQNCQECARLWSEFALATRHHLKVEGRLRIAEDSYDRKAVADLRPFLERAAAECAELRNQIEQHERAPVRA